ncbi:hypothetical protein BT69DRAFT_1345373 [Atractiella rhizophila]|nr:hypothetical protein BT69DRAFT_1345373 [Atractiella rhizophila]
MSKKGVEELRAELKRYERDFTSTHGHPPTKDDIKANPSISDMYKRYQTLRKAPSSKVSQSKGNKGERKVNGELRPNGHNGQTSGSLFDTNGKGKAKDGGPKFVEETPRKKAQSWLTGAARPSPLHRKWGSTFLSKANDPSADDTATSDPFSAPQPLKREQRQSQPPVVEEVEDEDEVLQPSPAKKDARKFVALFDIIGAQSPVKSKRSTHSIFPSSQPVASSSSSVDFLPPEPPSRPTLPQPQSKEKEKEKQPSLPFSSSKTSSSNARPKTAASRLARVNSERVQGANFEDERGPGTVDMDVDENATEKKKAKTRKKPPTNKFEVSERDRKRPKLFDAVPVSSTVGEEDEKEKFVVQEYQAFPPSKQGAFDVRDDQGKGKEVEDAEEELPPELMSLLSLSTPKEHIAERDRHRITTVKKLLNEPSLVLEAKRKGLEDLEDEGGEEGDEEEDDSEEWDEHNEGWKDTREALVDLEEDWGDVC